MNTKNPSDKPDVKVTRDSRSEPRLPNERDESADAQAAPEAPNDEVGRQAHEDVARGLVDTDEGKRAHVVQSGKSDQKARADSAAPPRRRG